MAETTTLQIRISVDDKEKIKRLSKEKGYKDTTEYIIDICCNDKVQLCNDNITTDKSNDNYFRLYHDLIPKYNYVKSLLNTRISIFDNDFSYHELGFFLWDIDFIEKFKNEYFREWKNYDSFNSLFTQLKKVYHLAYDAEQQEEIKLYGNIKSVRDEYRAIKKDDDLLEKEV